MNYMTKLIHIIEDKIFEDISLEFLAGQVHYSKYHISRTFNSTYGISISQYIQERRFAHAVQMLGTSGDLITSVALKCGFNSSAYFTKTFKNRFNMTPKQYMSGQHYIHLVEKIKTGEVKMYKNIDELNTYIYQNINDFESVRSLFAGLENAIYDKEEDMVVSYFALTVPEGAKGHIVWHCKLNMLSGTGDCRIVRNTVFLPEVTIDKMYRVDDRVYLDLYNNVSMTKARAMLVKKEPLLYRTDLCRFSDAYFEQVEHRDYPDLNLKEIDQLDKALSNLIKSSKNNIAFKKHIREIPNLQVLRMINDKALVTYMVNREDTSALITGLLDLKNRDYTYKLAHSFSNFGKKASVKTCGLDFDVCLDGVYMAKLNLITGKGFDLYNASYGLVLEDGTEDIFAVSFM